MNFERISKLKNAALVFTMLTFAVVAVLEGVAVGDVQTNVEQPVLEISKTMTSGETTVYTNTKEYWTLEIVVTYDDQTDLSGVVVRDTIPLELTLDGTTVSKGSVSTSTKNEATILTWSIGAMSPGDTETLTMSISTKTEESSDGGGGMGGGGTTTTQYFLEAGEYELNRGASVSGTHQSGTITAGPTDPITVYAEEERSRGGGMGGRWR